MSNKGAGRKQAVQIAMKGTLLGFDGAELDKGLWESAVYFGAERPSQVVLPVIPGDL